MITGSLRLLYTICQLPLISDISFFTEALRTKHIPLMNAMPCSVKIEATTRSY